MLGKELFVCCFSLIARMSLSHLLPSGEPFTKLFTDPPYCDHRIQRGLQARLYLLLRLRLRLSMLLGKWLLLWLCVRCHRPAHSASAYLDYQDCLGFSSQPVFKACGLWPVAYTLSCLVPPISPTHLAFLQSRQQSRQGFWMLGFFFWVAVSSWRSFCAWATSCPVVATTHLTIAPQPLPNGGKNAGKVATRAPPPARVAS